MTWAARFKARREAELAAGATVAGARFNSSL
jgi:RES domain-containing protein